MPIKEIYLKSCPFCGGSAEYEPQYDIGVWCFSDGCNYEGPKGTNGNDSVDKWNLRAPTETDQ